MQLVPLNDVLAESDSSALFGSEPQSSQTAKGLFASILDRQSEFCRKEELSMRAAASARARSASGGRIGAEDVKAAVEAARDAESADGSDGQGAPLGGAALAEAVARLKGEKSDDKSAHDLKVTEQEFKSIKKALQAFGMSDADIEAIAEKVSSEGGLTWGRLVGMVSAKAGELAKKKDAPELSLAEEGRLLGLFQKMGFTAEGARSLLTDLRNGDFDAAWDKIGAKLEAMPADKTLDLSAAELSALSKVLNLTGEAAAKLKSMLGGQESVRVSRESLKAVLAEVGQAVAEKADARLQSVVDLRDALKDIFDKAREAAEKRENTGRGPDDDARRSRILAEHDRRQEKAEKDAPKPGENAELAAKDKGRETEASKVLSGDPGKKTDAAAAKAAKAQAEAQAEADGKTGADGKAAKSADAAKASHAEASGRAAKAGGHAAGSEQAKDADASAKAARAKSVEARAEAAVAGKDGRDAARTGDAAGDKAGNKSGDGTGDKSEANREAWGKFWSKVRREDSGSGGEAGRSADAAAAKAADTVQFPTQDTAQAGTGKVLQRVMDGNAERILRQVEQGVLKSVGNGAKQLTLRLTPPDLGRVSLQIQVHEGQVRVMLRPENSDASKVISEHLGHIRHSLESQGLKVDKLEVQTQLADNQFKDGAWQGAQEHNETLQRQKDMVRLSRWRSLQSQGEGLAREMHTVHERARNSTQRLDIVA